MKIAFVSDIHSNLHAFSAVLEEIEREGIDEIYCCGDIVGYNAFPSECIELTKRYIKASVKGNHDYAVATGDATWFNEYGVAGVEYCRSVLSKDELNFLEKLPAHLYMEKEGIKFYIAHGSPRDEIFEYIFPNTSNEVYVELLELVNADIIVLGHTHIPMKKSVNNTLFINPGSVGQPRDGNPKASFMIFDLDSEEVHFRRVEYDIEKAKHAIIDRGLPLFLASRLDLGI